MFEKYHQFPANKFCQNLDEESNLNIELDSVSNDNKLKQALNEINALKFRLNGLENKLLGLIE